jgi:hypothetical protein
VRTGTSGQGDVGDLQAGRSYDSEGALHRAIVYWKGDCMAHNPQRGDGGGASYAVPYLSGVQGLAMVVE